MPEKKARRFTLYPTGALVGYKITLFTEKYKSFFEKKFFCSSKKSNFVTTHKNGGDVFGKVMKQARAGAEVRNCRS